MCGDASGVEVEVPDGEVDEFGDAHSCGVEEFEHGAVAQAFRGFRIWGVEEGFDFAFGEVDGISLGETRQVDVFGGVCGEDAVTGEEFEPLSECDEVSCEGAFGKW